MNRKTLVILAGLVILSAMIIVSCAQAPASPVKETVVVKETVIVAAPKPTEAPKPTTAPMPPVAVLKVVGVPANANLPGAITATLSYITDTAVGTAKTTVAMGVTALGNVPINVPVRLEVAAADPKNAGKPTWTLAAKPVNSKATITNTTALGAQFTPDTVGAYQVSVSLKNDAGLTSEAKFAFFNAGTFVGNDKDTCKSCHSSKTTE